MCFFHLREKISFFYQQVTVFIRLASVGKEREPGVGKLAMFTSLGFHVLLSYDSLRYVKIFAFQV